MDNKKNEQLKEQMTLSELPVGAGATITTVGGEGPLRLRFLDMGLIPRTLVRVQKVAPLGDPLEITLRGYELTLRKEDAAKILVVREDAGGANGEAEEGK